MDESQKSFQFPSQNLQEAVNTLWNKLKEVNGTIKFLTERNKELKEKLNTTGVVSKEDLSKMKDMERSIENLELENDEYLSRIAVNESKNTILEEQISSLEIYQVLYKMVLSSYGELKLESRSQTSADEIERLNNTIAQLDEQITRMKSDIDSKHKQILSSSEEILRLNNIIEKAEQNNELFSDLKSENERLNDIIDTISSSRDGLREESDNLKFEIERLRVDENHDIEKLKKDIVAYSEENVLLKSKLDLANRELAQANSQKAKTEAEIDEIKNNLKSINADNLNLKSQIDIVNEQLALADSIKKLVEKRDVEINELNMAMESINADNLVLQNRINDSKIEYENLDNQYQEAIRTIEDLQEDVENRMKKDNDINTDDFEHMKTDLEVKSKMISNFAQGEKELLGKIQYLEAELEAKSRSFAESAQSQRDESERLNSLENLLLAKDEKIDDLIRVNKGLLGKLSAAENSEAANEEIETRLDGLKAEYEDQLNGLSAESIKLQKQLKIKEDSIKILETHVSNMQDKIRKYEQSQIKSDEKLSLDEMIKENLISNLEKQLSRLEELSKK